MNHYKHNIQDIAITEEDGCLVVFNLRRGEASRLDSVGQVIWDNISDKNVEDIIGVIVENYNAERKEVENDVQVFIDMLLDKALIITEQ